MEARQGKARRSDEGKVSSRRVGRMEIHVGERGNRPEFEDGHNGTMIVRYCSNNLQVAPNAQRANPTLRNLGGKKKRVGGQWIAGSWR